MKQYQIIKAVYANSIRQAIEKEKEGVIMNVSYSDEFTEEDYKGILESKKQITKNIKDA